MTSPDASALGRPARVAPHKTAAAAVLLVRRAPRLEVYWIERAALLSYLGGFYGFPGGRVDRDDGRVPVAGVEDADEALWRAGAARELFEEAGVLIVTGGAAGLARAPRLAERERARTALIAGSLGFADFLAEHGLAVDGARLLPAGRWVSPAITPRGYDTRFYLAECPASESPYVIPGELSSGEWIEPERARAAWERGEVLLAPPVQRGLAGLVELAQAVARDAGAGSSFGAGPGATSDAAFAEALARCAHALCDLPETHGGPIPRVEMTPGVVTLPLVTATVPPATRTNCYVVGEGECLVVDPGSVEPAMQAELAAMLVRLEAEGRRPVAISVTHSHPDHVSGVAALRRSLGLPVWAHPQLAAKLGAERVLADGEVLVLAGGRQGPWRLEVLFTPGHARDHVVFFERARGVLVAGDMASGLSTVVLDPPDGDLDAYLASLRRLMALPVRSLFPGHGPPSGGARVRLAQIVEHRLWREGRLVEALRGGPATLAELVPRVYVDVAESQWRWARRSLLAHLVSLERRGEVRREAPRAGGEESAGPISPAGMVPREDERGVWRLA